MVLIWVGAKIKKFETFGRSQPMWKSVLKCQAHTGLQGVLSNMYSCDTAHKTHILLSSLFPKVKKLINRPPTDLTLCEVNEKKQDRNFLHTNSVTWMVANSDTSLLRQARRVPLISVGDSCKQRSWCKKNKHSSPFMQLSILWMSW